MYTLAESEAFLRSLPLKIAPNLSSLPEGGASLDPLSLPDALVSGGTMIAFDDTVPSNVRGSVSMSTLIAQHRANQLKVGKGSDKWIASHQDVLQRLNWTLEHNSTSEYSVSESGIGIHQAIIPFLTAALGPGGVAGSTIITSLQNLSEADKEKKWFKLYDRETRALKMSEQFFGHVTVENGSIVMRLAAVGLSGEHCRRQILLFKTSRSQIVFRGRALQFRANPDMLTAMHGPLSAKLQGRAEDFLAALDIG